MRTRAQGFSLLFFCVTLTTLAGAFLLFLYSSQSVDLMLQVKSENKVSFRQACFDSDDAASMIAPKEVRSCQSPAEKLRDWV
jgi:hypothetical protein